MYSQNNARQAPSNSFLGSGYTMEADMSHGHLVEESHYPPTFPNMPPNGHYMDPDYQGPYLAVPDSGHISQSAYTNVTSHHGYLQPGLQSAYPIPPQFQHPQMTVGTDPHALEGSNPQLAGKYEPACEKRGVLYYKNSLTPSPKNVADRRSLSSRERALKENGLFVCNFCGDQFARRDRMENCWNSHHGFKAHMCRGECGDASCTQAYANADALRRHQWPKEQREVICDWCKNPSSRQNIARHKLRCTKRPAGYTGN